MLKVLAHLQREIIVTLNKRFQALFMIVVFSLGCAMPSTPKNDSLFLQGVVVAIQRGKTDARLLEPESFADLAEIYMVRADHWSSPIRKEKYILVQYLHHTGLIEYAQFDNTRWIFELHHPSPETNKECLSWVAREAAEKLTFMPTALGAKAKLPEPQMLPCFLMTERPSVAR
jgi:hypothetical protein